MSMYECKDDDQWEQKLSQSEMDNLYIKLINTGETRVMIKIPLENIRQLLFKYPQLFLIRNIIDDYINTKNKHSLRLILYLSSWTFSQIVSWMQDPSGFQLQCTMQEFHIEQEITCLAKYLTSNKMKDFRILNEKIKHILRSGQDWKPVDRDNPIEYISRVTVIMPINIASFIDDDDNDRYPIKLLDVFEEIGLNVKKTIKIKILEHTKFTTNYEYEQRWVYVKTFKVTSEDENSITLEFR